MNWWIDEKMKVCDWWIDELMKKCKVCYLTNWWIDEVFDELMNWWNCVILKIDELMKNYQNMLIFEHFVKIVAFVIFPKNIDFSEILQNDRSKKLGLLFEQKWSRKWSHTKMIALNFWDNGLEKWSLNHFENDRWKQSKQLKTRQNLNATTFAKLLNSSKRYKI